MALAPKPDQFRSLTGSCRVLVIDFRRASPISVAPKTGVRFWRNADLRGVSPTIDPSLKGRIAELTAVRDQAQADAERAISAVERLGLAITSDSLRRFALAARRKLRNEDGTYRRDHLRALAQRVEVIDPSEIRIMGSKTELLRKLAAAASAESAAAGVRSFIPKWRALRDSNS